MCISGGPISQLEVEEIKGSLVEEAESDLKSREGMSDLSSRIEVVEVSFAQFKEFVRRY